MTCTNLFYVVSLLQSRFNDRRKYITDVDYYDLENGLAKLKKLINEQELLQQERVAWVLSKVKIIGMTITGAAIKNSILEKVCPKVVLVEEAAQVLEPLLITAVPCSTEHLIMVGDHNQLPPQLNVNDLKKTGFDKSMMQRLAEGGMPFIQLKLQNRMRSELAELLRDIYPKLKSNHSAVDRIQLPTTIPFTSIFWSHSHLEVRNRTLVSSRGEGGALKTSHYREDQNQQDLNHVKLKDLEINYIFCTLNIILEIHTGLVKPEQLSWCLIYC